MILTFAVFLDELDDRIEHKSVLQKKHIFTFTAQPDSVAPGGSVTLCLMISRIQIVDSKTQMVKTFAVSFQPLRAASWRGRLNQFKHHVSARDKSNSAMK